jgi:hypothetical protein
MAVFVKANCMGWLTVVLSVAAFLTACTPAELTQPPPPPDLDCGDIQYRRFAVLQPDPHHFDADKDGIGCES